MFTFEYHNALFTLVYLNQRALIIVNVPWENYIAEQILNKYVAI